MKKISLAFLLSLVSLFVVIPARADDVIWATGTVTLSSALTEAIATLLETTPPEDAETMVYALTYVSGSNSSWTVSVINLYDVVAPYEEWNAEINGAWAGNVVCTGTEPTWTCDYPEEEPAGGTTSMIFPWQSGYSAKFGVKAVHQDPKSVIPGSYAVDFVGYDNISTSMPRNVIAVADGNLDWICEDPYSMAIRVSGGPVPVAYFHFALGNVFTYGPVSQGQVLGTLRSNSFSGNCGTGSQGDNAYHLHFVFLPTNGNFLEIGGAVLDVTTNQFVLNGNTYGVNSFIPNGGGASVIDPDADDGGAVYGSGGAHIWDGIVNAIVQLSQNSVEDLLQDQDPFVGYMINKVSLIVQAIFSLFVLVYTGGMSATMFLVILVSLIGCEIAYWTFKIGFWLIKIVF